MKISRQQFLLALILLLSILITSCGSKPGEVSSGSNDAGGATDLPEATSAPKPTEPPAIQVDAPAAGMSSAYGRIYWNDEPVAGTEVKLCNEVVMVSGCDATEFSTTTDNDGIYILKDVTSGEYVIMVKVPSSDYWVYVTSNFGISAEKQEFKADVTQDFGVQSIIRFDVQVTSPQNEAQLTDARPVLDWEDYPGAASYEVYVSPDQGTSTSDTVKESTYTVPADLLNCTYSWKISALNANGQELAEFEDYRHFEVTGQQAGCVITLSGPADGSKQSTTGIHLTWEANPLADHYLVYVTDMDYNNIIDGYEVSGTEFTIPSALDAGDYQWYVNAYRGSDSIAVSTFSKFTVE